MSRRKFQELLDAIAEQAEPIDDLAERALRKSRRPFRTGRMPRMPVVMTAGLAVAGVLTLVALGLPAVREEAGSIAGEPVPVPVPTASAESLVRGTKPVGKFTAIDPPARVSALPAKGVGPVLMTYRVDCSDPSGTGDCGRWRVMTESGRHYQVEDATWIPSRNPNGPGVITVSPDGRRIAYTRNDGSFVIRDLRSGLVTPVLELPTAVFDNAGERASWSADGRWIVLGYDPPQLIDTKKRTHAKLEGFVTFFGFGVSDGSHVFPVRYEDKEAVALLDKAGRVEGDLDVNGPLQGAAGDIELGAISPTGKRFATVAYNQDRTTTIAFFDVETKQLIEQRRVNPDAPATEAWMDEHRILLTWDQSGERRAAALDTRTGELENLLRVTERVEATGFATALL